MYDLNEQKETSTPVVTNYAEVHTTSLTLTPPSPSFAAGRLNCMKLLTFNHFLLSANWHLLRG